MEPSRCQFGAGEFRIIEIESAESDPVASPEPQSIVIVEASPKTFVFAAIAKVAEEGVDVLKPYPLLVDR